jgi:hypothetical protein
MKQGESSVVEPLSHGQAAEAGRTGYAKIVLRRRRAGKRGLVKQGDPSVVELLNHGQACGPPQSPGETVTTHAATIFLVAKRGARRGGNSSPRQGLAGAFLTIRDAVRKAQAHEAA